VHKWATFGAKGKGRTGMIELHTPNQTVFLIALVLLVLAMVGYFVTIPFVTQYQFWLAVAGYVVLALGCVV
jgi:hypothetical protein